MIQSTNQFKIVQTWIQSMYKGQLWDVGWCGTVSPLQRAWARCVLFKKERWFWTEFETILPTIWNFQSRVSGNQVILKNQETHRSDPKHCCFWSEGHVNQDVSTHHHPTAVLNTVRKKTSRNSKPPRHQKGVRNSLCKSGICTSLWFTAPRSPGSGQFSQALIPMSTPLLQQWHDINDINDLWYEWHQWHVSSDQPWSNNLLGWLREI